MDVFRRGIAIQGNQEIRQERLLQHLTDDQDKNSSLSMIKIIKARKEENNLTFIN